MKCFFGREHELNELQLLTQKHVASLAVVTGRRRIGKSRLIEEFAKSQKKYKSVFISGLPPEKGVTAKMQKNDFALQMERALHIPPVKRDDWSDLFIHLANHTKRGKWIILLDEVSWLAQKSQDFLGKFKTAWDLHFKKNPKIILLLCSSISTWIEKNILSSTGFLGRISLNLKLDELKIENCIKFWGNNQTYSAFDMFKIMSITGGVPRYLEEIITKQTAEENIRRLCFYPEGILFNEFGNIFSDLFSHRSSIYKKIVHCLIQKKMNLQTLCDLLKVEKSGVMSEYLNDLSMAGFIAKDYTWNLKKLEKSRSFQYRIKDNYIRFYLKYIQPNEAKILNKRLSNISITTLPGWSVIMGLQFENLVLQNKNSIIKALGIDPTDVVQDGSFFQNQTIQKEGCQIDYLIQTRHGPLYVCEIKFHKQNITATVIREVEKKINRLKVPKYCSIIPVLIHVNGVNETVIESDFFFKVIDFSIFLARE